MCEHTFANPVRPVQTPCYHKLYYSCQVLSPGVNSWNVLSPKTSPQIVTVLSYIIPAPSSTCGFCFKRGFSLHSGSWSSRALWWWDKVDSSTNSDGLIFNTRPNTPSKYCVVVFKALELPGRSAVARRDLWAALRLLLHWGQTLC